MGKFVYVEDPTDQQHQSHSELFSDCEDMNTIPQVARVFGVCPQTIRNLIARGDLNCVHVGRAVRVTKKAMVEFIAAQEVSYES